MPLKGFISNEDGVAAVEMALMLPFFITLVIGAVDTSNLLLETHRVERGLELGATYLTKADNPGAVVATARNVAVTGSPTGGTSRVRGWGTEDITILLGDSCATGRSSCNADDFRRGDRAYFIVMESSHTYEGFGLLAGIMRGGLTIDASHEERIDL